MYFVYITYRSLRKKNNKQPAPRMGQIRRNPVEKVKKSSSSFERTGGLFRHWIDVTNIFRKEVLKSTFKVENTDGSDFHGVMYIYIYILYLYLLDPLKTKGLKTNIGFPTESSKIMG